MRLTQKDTELFTSLHKTSLGDGLCGYLERLMSEICDSRNWGENDTKEGARKVANYIQREIVDRIRLTGVAKGQTNPNDYE